MGRNVIGVVSQSALRHNFAVVKALAANAKIIAMIKANAYGHGLITVAKTLKEADALGVACIEEALLIRKAGVKTDIILMEGFFREEELPIIDENHFTIVVHHFAQIQALINYTRPLQRKFKVWLKINTGMNRLGFQAHEFHDAWDALSRSSHVELIGSMTHFPSADQKENDSTVKQTARFHQIVGERQGQKSLANSAGILAWPKTHGDWVRPGLILYGASPFPQGVGSELNLKPAMSLYSEIIAIRDIEKLEKVGYGGTWQNDRNISKIGIVAIGYGDGYPWHAKNGTPVLVNGQRVTTVGRVSMDMLAVDVTQLPNVKVGDSVTLWGEGLPIEEIARHAQTIPWELYCRFTERVTVKIKE